MRLLDAASAQLLDRAPKAQQQHNLVFLIGDGMSSLAIEQNCVPFLQHLLLALQLRETRIGPVGLVKMPRQRLATKSPGPELTRQHEHRHDQAGQSGLGR